MTYAEILRHIEGVADLPGRLERFHDFKKLLKTYHRDAGCSEPVVSILIAGTNGKGTVAKTLETLLRARFEGVALFTSPHIMDATERLRSFGRDISEEEFCKVFNLVRPLHEKHSLGRFETFTLMAYEFFFGGRVRKAVTHAVIEVGVGGRLDPTNAIPHSVSVITSIGLDHQAVLGPTIREISGEKFGIVSPGNLLVHGPLPEEAKEALRQAASLRGVRVHEAPVFPASVDHSNADPVWILETPWGNASLSLSGRRAVENTSIALEILRRLDEATREALPELLWHLQAVVWPCRMEKLNVSGRRVYLSGDHNVDGVESLKELLSEFTYDRVFLVVGIGANKPIDEMLEAFSKIPRSKIIQTDTPFRSSKLAAMEPMSALEQALESATPDDLIVVSGSLYLVGYVRSRLINAMT